MKNYLIVILLVLSGIGFGSKLDVNSLVDSSDKTVLVSGDEDKVVKSDILDAIKQDEYTDREIKELYTIFRGSEWWLDKFDGLGANNVDQVIDRFRSTFSKLDVKLKSNLEKVVYNDVFKKFEEVKNDGDFQDDKRDIQQEMYHIANAIEKVATGE